LLGVAPGIAKKRGLSLVRSTLLVFVGAVCLIGAVFAILAWGFAGLTGHHIEMVLLSG
jgi:hypothetical protein